MEFRQAKRLALLSAVRQSIEHPGGQSKKRLLLLSGAYADSPYSRLQLGRKPLDLFPAAAAVAAAAALWRTTDPGHPVIHGSAVRATGDLVTGPHKWNGSTEH